MKGLAMMKILSHVVRKFKINITGFMHDLIGYVVEPTHTPHLTPSLVSWL